MAPETGGSNQPTTQKCSLTGYQPTPQQQAIGLIAAAAVKLEPTTGRPCGWKVTLNFPGLDPAVLCDETPWTRACLIFNRAQLAVRKTLEFAVTETERYAATAQFSVYSSMRSRPAAFARDFANELTLGNMQRMGCIAG